MTSEAAENVMPPHLLCTACARYPHDRGCPVWLTMSHRDRLLEAQLAARAASQGKVKPTAARNTGIFHQVIAGKSATEIALGLGITKMRVGQIFKREYRRRHPMQWQAACIRDNVDETTEHHSSTGVRSPRVTTLRYLLREPISIGAQPDINTTRQGL